MGQDESEKRPGPKPKRLKLLHKDWREAVKKALREPRLDEDVADGTSDRPREDDDS